MVSNSPKLRGLESCIKNPHKKTNQSLTEINHANKSAISEI